MGWGRGYERLILLGGGYSSPSLAGVLGGPPVCQSCGWCLTRLTRLPACRPACLQVMALVQVLDNLDQYGVGQVGAGADAGGRASEWSGVGCGAVGHCTPHATCCMLRRLVDCGPLICRSCCRSWLSLCWTPSLAAGAVLPEQQVQRGIHAGHGQQQHLLPRGCC